MGVLREVLASFAVNVDVKPLTEMDRKIEKLKGQIKTVAGVAATGFAAATAAAWGLVQAASSADETFAALRATIGEGAARNVQSWASEQANLLGRSMYDLMGGVQQFSAFLEPQLKGTGHDIATMSKRLSELAVDLAAFYDTADAEAQMRLFSGMSGETEAVRRLGIDISDTALSNFNHTVNKDSRNLAQLTLQEKTLLRYNKILEDTQKKQGHAAKEAQQWAGSLKRVEGLMKDMAVKWGRRLRDGALQMLRLFEKTLKAVEATIETVVMYTSTIQTTMGLIATAATAWAIQTAIVALSLPGVVAQLASSLALTTAMAAKWAAIFLVVEDIVTFFRGGDSTVGRMLELLTGMQDPLGGVQFAFQMISVYINNAVQGVISLAKYLGTVAAGLLKVGAVAAMPGLLMTQKGRDMLAGGVEDLKSAANGSAFDTSKLINPDDVKRELLARRDEGFKGAVEAGDLAGAAKNPMFRRPGEDENQAYARALSWRKFMVETGQIPATAADIGSGFQVPRTADGAISIAPQEIVGSTSKTITMPTQNVSGGVTIYVTNANMTVDEVDHLIEKYDREQNERATKDLSEAP